MPATAVTSVMRKSIHQLMTKMFSSVPSAQSLMPSSHFKVKIKKVIKRSNWVNKGQNYHLLEGDALATITAPLGHIIALAAVARVVEFLQGADLEMRTVGT